MGNSISKPSYEFDEFVFFSYPKSVSCKQQLCPTTATNPKPSSRLHYSDKATLSERMKIKKE